MQLQNQFPESVQSEEELLELLTQPSAKLTGFFAALAGPLVVLGAGGKMGPTLCVLAKRAAESAGNPIDIIAVSRFSDSAARQWLESRGVKTVSADLLNCKAVLALPDAPNVVSLIGLKFGTADNPSLTWATNTLGPAYVAERYAGSRIVALSTGNVYPLVPATEGGAKETNPLTPMGEYANAAIARERIFDYFSRRNDTAIALLRLNYAVELRYGVLADIGRKVWAGESIDLGNGWFNCIWQGDANDMILRSLSLASSPASAWNLSRPIPLRVRDVAEQFARLLDKPVQFTGTEAPDALICNPTKLCEQLGQPPTPLEKVIEWTAHWIRQGGRNLNRPTHFEVRDGKY